MKALGKVSRQQMFRGCFCKRSLSRSWTYTSVPFARRHLGRLPQLRPLCSRPSFSSIPLLALQPVFSSPDTLPRGYEVPEQSRAQVSRPRAVQPCSLQLRPAWGGVALGPLQVTKMTQQGPGLGCERNASAGTKSPEARRGLKPSS